MLTPPPAAANVGLGRLVARWLALPLSILPFLAYATLTPEGRLVRDRVIVALAPPQLPALSARQRANAEALAPRYDGAVMVLGYHGIGSASDGEGGFVVSPGRFGEHLVTLRAAGMNVVTAGEVDEAFRGGEPLPPNAVMLTFDDGRADAMMFADPLLRQAGMKATMFVITDAASRSGVYYAPWKKLKRYARSGRWDIQSHTAGSHHQQKVPQGGTLPALTSLGRGESLDEYRERIRADLTEASDAIHDNIGRRPVAFAYPFGAYGADRTNDPAVRAVLREEVGRNYGLAFHQDDQEQISLATGSADRLGLRRLEVGGWSGTFLLQHIADAARRSGFGPPLHVPDRILDADLPPGHLSQLAVAPPDPVTAAGVAPPGSPPAAPADPADQVAPGAVASAPPGAVAPSSAPAPAPAPTLPPYGGPIPTTVGPPTVTTPPATAPPVTSPPATTPPTTRPAATTPPTTRPPTPPTTTCPSTGKPPPGCPPRGGGR